MFAGTVLTLLLSSLGQMDTEFHQDLRGGQRVHHALTPFGPNRAQAIGQDSKGLRITLPAKRPDTAAVGFAPTFRISGDFEITVAYEILSANEPSSGYGVGLKIWAKIRSDDDQTVTLAHLIRPQQPTPTAEEGAPAAEHKVRNEFVAAFSHQGPDPEGERSIEANSLATDAYTGRLRLTRSGSDLIFQAAEGEEETFQELQRVEVGTDALMSLRISANTSGVACGLSIRLLDIRIRAASLPGAARPKNDSKSRLVIWLSAIAVMGTGGFLLWRYKPWRT